MMCVQVAFNGPSQWPDGGGLVPMGIKRKVDKKEKKAKKKDSKYLTKYPSGLTPFYF